MFGPCVRLLVRCFLWWEEWGSQATRDQEDTNFACFFRPLSHHHFVWREILPCFKRFGRSQMAKLQPQEVGSTRFTISPTRKLHVHFSRSQLHPRSPPLKNGVRTGFHTGSWKLKILKLRKQESAVSELIFIWSDMCMVTTWPCKLPRFFSISQTPAYTHIAQVW